MYRIESEKADISNFTWKIYNVEIFESNQPKKDEDYIVVDIQGEESIHLLKNGGNCGNGNRN